MMEKQYRPEEEAKLKKDSRLRDLEAKKNAQSEYESSLLKLDETIAKEEKGLTLRAQQGEISKEEAKSSIQLLRHKRKNEIKKLKTQCSFNKRHRHYLDHIDAFFSRPPMWVVNLVTFLIFAGFFVYFGFQSGFFTGFGKGHISNVTKFFEGFFVPDYNLFFGTGRWSFDQSVLFLCLQTFAIAFLGTLFASLFAIPFGFLASHKLMGRWAIISEIILIIIRTIPEIVFCLILVQWIGFSPLTGVVVLSIQSIGMVGKMYSDDLDSMDMTFLESLDASGAKTLTKIRVGIFPQVSGNFISTILYRFDLNLRNASILGLVGAGDLGRLILDYTNNQNWPQLGALLWGLLVMVLLVDLVSTQIRKKLV